MSTISHELQKFARYEFKYILNWERTRVLDGEVSQFMTYDGHICPKLGNRYIVRSLYFDDLHASSYYDKTDGLKTRRKYRLRTYGTAFEPGLPIFLEEKGRHNERTYKLRIAIDPEHLSLFTTPERHAELLRLYPDTELVERFVFDAMRRRLVPRVLVDYKRRPFTSEYDMNFRVTLDSELRAAATTTLFPGPATTWHAAVAGYTIVEIKFNRRIPAWFHRILQAHNLRRQSISKFCKGMEITGLATNLE